MLPVAMTRLAVLFTLLLGSLFALEERRDSRQLYRPGKLVSENYLQVSDAHSLYYAIYGSPTGIPVVVLHGGPGGFCSPELTRFFDLKVWKVILFDQRGALRSLPFGLLEENTPQHSIEDIEKLRNHLGIAKWVVFGESWGSALAMLYGQAHPNSCLGFILSGVFLARVEDCHHILHGMGRFYPEAHQRMVEFIPENERSDLMKAYYRRVMDSDPAVCFSAAREFMRYDFICATHRPSREAVSKRLENKMLTLNLARTFLHYSMNGFFLQNNQILNEIGKVSKLPALIVQGRWDAICPPEMAYSVHQKWENSALWLVTEGSHSVYEPPFSSTLVEATDFFGKLVLQFSSKDNASPPSVFAQKISQHEK